MTSHPAREGSNSTFVTRPCRALGYTTLFSLAIAALLWILAVAEPLWASVLVSLSIGWSITLAFVFVGGPVSRVLPAYIAPVPIVGLGLLTGLVIAGSILFGQPLYFVTEDYYSLLLGVFFGAVGFAIFGVRGRLMETRAELALAQAEREAQEKLLLETELKLLQAQIEPHFLFNTLSNVVGLIHTHPADAERTLLNLTTLLRASLKRTRKDTITLCEEIDIVSAYLEIQKTRMHGRLNYEIEVDEAARAFPLPPLLVQPLVENALKHGLEPAEAGGTVRIESRRLEQGLEIEVRDTGVGFHFEQANHGTGLINVRNRLDALYDGRANMKIVENQPSGVSVTLTLPEPIT